MATPGPQYCVLVLASSAKIPEWEEMWRQA